MARKPKLFFSCQYVHDQKVREGTLDLFTGEVVMGPEKIVRKECGIPLFGDDNKKIGRCRAHMPAKVGACADKQEPHDFSPNGICTKCGIYA